jgi:hypothetical protein
MASDEYIFNIDHTEDKTIADDQEEDGEEVMEGIN